MEVKTRYDPKKKAAIIVEPREIKVAKRDYEAIQRVTGGQFGYLFITEKLDINKRGKVTYLNLEYIKGEPFDLDVQNLHSDIAKLTSLRALSLRMNELRYFPEALRGLTRLKRLWVYENNLQELPDWIGELKGLEILNLGQNALKCIPESIGKLHSLRELLVVQNPIRTLPDSLTQISTLEKIVIEGKWLDERSKAIKKTLKSKGVDVVI